MIIQTNAINKGSSKVKLLNDFSYKQKKKKYKALLLIWHGNHKTEWIENFFFRDSTLKYVIERWNELDFTLAIIRLKFSETCEVQISSFNVSIAKLPAQLFSFYHNVE